MRDFHQRLAAPAIGILLAAAFLAATAPAPGAVIAHDTFGGYSDGLLNGNNGGSGDWSGAWVAANEPGYNVWSVVSPGLVPGSHHAVQHVRDAGSRLPSSSIDDRSAKRPISTAVASTTTHYFGLLFTQEEGVTGGTNNVFDTRWNFDGRFMNFGVQGNNLFVETRSSTTVAKRTVAMDNAIIDGQVHMILVKFEQDQGGTPDSGLGGGTAERVSIFLDPTGPVEPGTADLVQIGGPSITFNPGQTLDQVRIYADYYNGTIASFDRLVVATSFAEAYEVLTIPEPSTLAMLAGLAGFGLLGWLRRPRRRKD